MLGPVAAAALLLSALPGSALAKPLNPVPGVFDQGVAASQDGDGAAQYGINSAHLTQGITPAHTGLLTHIDLNCAGDSTTLLTLTVGSSTAQNVCVGGGYRQFVFSSPATVTSGSPFTLGIDTGGATVSMYYTTVPYAGGAAANGGDPIVTDGETPVTIASFSFMTYVATPPTTTYTWNPTSVVASQSTAATLTAVTSFPISINAPSVLTAAAQPNGFSGTMPFTLKLAALPAWFTPTGIQCSAAVTNCSIPNFSAGLTGTMNGLVAGTVTVTVTGTAAPPSGATGASGQTSGKGCNTWDVGADTVSSCGTGQSVLGIVGQPTPAPTLPPTTTSGNSTSDGPSPLLLLWTLPALLAAAATLLRREARDHN